MKCKCKWCGRIFDSEELVTNEHDVPTYCPECMRSGFWSVWIDGDWVEASLPNEEAARKYVKERYGAEV